MKPRKFIKRTSKARAAQIRKYPQVRAEFLVAHTKCFRCQVPLTYWEREVHHFYGKVHGLLCWVSGFRCVCRGCHSWIEHHRNDSVQLGFRASNKLFNRPSLVMAFTNTQE